MTISNKDLPTISSLSGADREKIETGLRRGATRREVMTWLMASGATIAAAGSIVTSANVALAATPKKGGHMKYATYSQSPKDTLDPTKMSYSNDYLRAFTHFDTLTELDINNNPQPRLATSWEAEDGGKKWIFELRKGVTFHNGKTFTSADVIWSIMRHKDPKVGSAAKALADPIESIVADGPNRVIFNLSGPNADFSRLVALYSLLISVEGETDFTKGAGTGPYLISDFRPGVRSAGERNPNYFGNAYLDSLEGFAITDNVARANAVIAGEVDYVTQLDGNSLDVVNASKKAYVFNTPAPAWYTLAMQMDQGPFKSKDFRNAIKYMFDRDRLLKTTFKGYGVKANDHLFHPSSPYYNADLPQRDLDLDKAKSLIKKSGFEGETIELHVSEAAGNSIDMGLMLQQSAARAGITVQLKREPSDGYWSNIWLKRGFFGSNWNPRPVYDTLLSLVYSTGSKWNETHLSNPKLDELIVMGRGETDEVKRKEIYGDVQEILYEEDGHATVAFKDYLDGASNRLKGLQKIPQGAFCGFNFANKVWLDDA